MIDSLSTLSGQSAPAAVRTAPPAAPTGGASAPAPAASGNLFVRTITKVDNLQGAVILAYVSSAGQVVGQSPTRSQILAYKAAAHLQSEQQDSSPPAPATDGGSGKSVVV